MKFALVADDHPDAAELALSSVSVGCLVTRDAHATLSALRACVPDAVVLDLLLPGVTDPRAFALQVRSLFAGRVVVASGADPRVVHRIADAIGAVALPKPHLRADLVRAVTGDT